MQYGQNEQNKGRILGKSAGLQNGGGGLCDANASPNRLSESSAGRAASAFPCVHSLMIGSRLREKYATMKRGAALCNNNLVEALDNIAKISISPLSDGYSETIGEFYDAIIEPMLPKVSIVRSWQSLLYTYVKDPDAIFFLRRYGSVSDKNYEDLRRGFFTEYDRGGYVCCDNSVAQYIFALSIAGIVPTLSQLKDAILARRFPCSFFGTKEECELQAYATGKAPRINSSGWKLAHLIPVNGRYLSIDAGTFVDAHFPRGRREEWTLTSQGYHARLVHRQMTPDERGYLVSHFIRLASPINYFLVPKPDNERDAYGKNIGENKHVLEYAAMRFRERYGDALGEFARAADAPAALIAGRDTSTQPVKITYRSDKDAFDTSPSKPAPVKTDMLSGRLGKRHVSANTISKEQLHEMARLYLEESVSFRNLEQMVLGIAYRTRGGGFVAQKALNDFGITASDKGMLARMCPEAAAKTSVGMLKKAICELYGIRS